MHKLGFGLRWAVTCALFSLAACGGKSGTTTISFSSGDNSKIINGTPIDPSAQPQVVRLSIVFDLGGITGTGLCTGTVISADKILTAAHCLEAGPVISATVESGIVGAIPVSSIAIHPLRAVSPGNYDVAVLRTSVPHGLPAIGMRVSSAVPVSAPIMISGYGKTKEENYGELRTGNMIIDGVDELRIYSVFREELSDTCFGDSGGPAFFTDFTPEGAVSAVGIVGITEAGTSDACDAGETSIFTNLNNPDVIQFLQSVAPEAMYY